MNTPTDGCLSGRVCLVLGAGAATAGWAIGQAIAIAYARASAQVMVGDLNLEAAKATVDFIRSEGHQAQACLQRAPRHRIGNASRMPTCWHCTWLPKPPFRRCGKREVA
jgi:NAD(P)-dependent dehydrogenase (short-subunit alcohol dehydrogenase family)